MTELGTEGQKLLGMFTLHNKKWHYKGEGNANVVLAFPEENSVVRVMKDYGGGDDMMKTLLMRINFCDAIQKLFFSGCDYVNVPIPMYMSTEELYEIDQRLQQYRPSNRTHKGLGWSGGVVAICSDHTTVLPQQVTITGRTHIYCAEIKPKQGWLHEADRPETGRKCAFCAHQYLKLSRGDIWEISGYCPLDLFSGCRERVKHAIHELFRSPQNNLKMFMDGIPLDNHGCKLVANKVFDDDGYQLCAFIAAALLGNFDHGEEPIETLAEESVTLFQANRESKLCDFNAVPMPQNCVLHKILTMQKMQSTGFETVCSEYNRLPETITQFGHVDRLLASTNLEDIKLNPVDGYLVAATARDCSVFVTFCQFHGDSVGQHVVWFGNHWYMLNIKVSDLDPKPLSTIEKHQKRNAKVLVACNLHLNQE